MKVSIGGNRRTNYWKKTELSFSELFDRVSNPIVTSETFNTYLSLSKDEQDDIKDVGGFVGGELKNGSRKKENVINRSLLALDADYLGNSANLEGLLDKLNQSNIEFITYTTRKHTNEAPRIRILIPFKEPINPEAYEPIARKVCFDLGMSYFDPTTVETNRLMYFPSVSSDMADEFFSSRNLFDAKPLDGMAFLNQNYHNWRDQTEWDRFPNEEENIQRDVSVQQDPLTKEGIIGKFCEAYTIQEAIATFLPSIYEPVTEDRYTYLKGSTAGGAVIYEDKFLYSHHATDPANTGHVCNAFDLVRIHKYGDTKQSVKEMTSFAAQDERVQKLTLEEDFKDFIELVEEDNQEPVEITEEDKTTLKDILEKLSKNAKGENESTIDNMLLILNSDPNLKEFYNDIFSDWIVVTGKLPWVTNEIEECPRGWTDTDDGGLRWYLEKYYKITGLQKMLDALNLSFQKRSVHPVREYFESLEWDGKPRVETLLIDYFGAEDNVYTREVMKIALTAAVTRIYKPGTKFDNMPIIVGSQGIGKSTFLATLGKDWFSDSLTEFTGKDAMELLNGNLIIEIGELNGFRKAEMDAIKQFLSKQVDEYRAPYARRKEAHKRQCIFFGTTNESTFLRDLTGNRRFLPVQSYPERITKSVWDDLPNEVDQIWAEAYSFYLLGQELRLSPEAEKIAKVEQDSRLEEDPRKDMIIEFLLQEVPKNWAEMSIEARRMFLDNPEAIDEELVKRDRICASEVNCELFGYTTASMNRRTAGDINRLLDSIPGLKKSKNSIRFGNEYGRARGYYIEPEFYELMSTN